MLNKLAFQKREFFILLKCIPVIILISLIASCTRQQTQYKIIVGVSHASANEAAKSAELQLNNLAIKNAVIGIAASSMCCVNGSNSEGSGTLRGGTEWDNYILVQIQ
jgi:hypothetical protein